MPLLFSIFRQGTKREHQMGHHKHRNRRTSECLPYFGVRRGSLTGSMTNAGQRWIVRKFSTFDRVGNVFSVQTPNSSDFFRLQKSDVASNRVKTVGVSDGRSCPEPQLPSQLGSSGGVHRSLSQAHCLTNLIPTSFAQFSFLDFRLVTCGDQSSVQSVLSVATASSWLKVKESVTKSMRSLDRAMAHHILSESFRCPMQSPWFGCSRVHYRL